MICAPMEVIVRLLWQRNVCFLSVHALYFVTITQWFAQFPKSSMSFHISMPVHPLLSSVGYIKCYFVFETFPQSKEINSHSSISWYFGPISSMIELTMVPSLLFFTSYLYLWINPCTVMTQLLFTLCITRIQYINTQQVVNNTG